MGKFINKHMRPHSIGRSIFYRKRNVSTVSLPTQDETVENVVLESTRVENVSAQETKTVSETKNKKTKKSKDMTTVEKIQQASSILSSVEAPQAVKRVKKDKGLIERTESSKIILTEDNKELLVD